MKTYEVEYTIEISRTVEVKAGSTLEAVKLVKQGKGDIMDTFESESSLEIVSVEVVEE